MKKVSVFAVCVVVSIATMFLLVPDFLFASSSGQNGAHSFAPTFLWIAILLLAAKLSSLVEKVGQPSVLGELLVGIFLGNLVLLGIGTFSPVLTNETIIFLAELGVVILLFQIGLESNIRELQKVGFRAFLVGLIGVVAPFALGAYLLGPVLLPGLDTNSYLFLGAALTATSVGITARVFKDLGKLKTPESQMVLGAAVFDDVMGLIILAVVSSIAIEGSITAGAVAAISIKSIVFLVGSIVLGQILATPIGKLFAKIQTGSGMKFTIAIAFCLLFAVGAELIGLAPIIGAFAAGLILDPVHFRHFKHPEVISDVKKAMKDAPEELRASVTRAIKPHARRHVEELIEPLSYLLVPIFFVVTGMQVDVSTLFDKDIILAALGITAVAFVGKFIAGLAAGPDVNKAIVGFGMVPRGEVGLIFAAMGSSLGVISNEVFSVIVVMVIFTTLATPPMLTFLLKRQKTADSGLAPGARPVTT